LFSHLSYLVLQDTLQKRKPRRQRTGALCMQHSPTAAVLSTSFLLNHAPSNSLELNALTTRFIMESCSSVSMSCKSKRLKKSGSWLNFHNALIQHLSEKCNFRVSRFPGSAEAYHIISYHITQHLLWRQSTRAQQRLT